MLYKPRSVLSESVIFLQGDISSYWKPGACVDRHHWSLHIKIM
ncbi:MAG: hypothetical protein RL354_1100 [Planctomycetota bacterium]